METSQQDRTPAYTGPKLSEVVAKNLSDSVQRMVESSEEWVNQESLKRKQMNESKQVETHKDVDSILNILKSSSIEANTMPSEPTSANNDTLPSKSNEVASNASLPVDSVYRIPAIETIKEYAELTDVLDSIEITIKVEEGEQPFKLKDEIQKTWLVSKIKNAKKLANAYEKSRQKLVGDVKKSIDNYYMWPEKKFDSLYNDAAIILNEYVGDKGVNNYVSVEVLDIKKVPEEFLTIDTKKLKDYVNKIHKTSKEIPTIEGLKLITNKVCDEI